MFVLGIMVFNRIFLMHVSLFYNNATYVSGPILIAKVCDCSAYVEINCKWSLYFGHFVFCPCICIFGLYCVPFFASTCSLFCLLVLYISSLTFLLISDCLRYVFGGHWIITWHQYALLMILWWFKTNAVSFYSVLYNEI